MFKEHHLLGKEREYIYDEKRGVVVNTRTMTSFQFNIYKRGFYKRMRPDLTDSDFYRWKETWKIGEQYMNQLGIRHNLEILRAAVSGQTSLQPFRRAVFEENSRRLTVPFIKSYRYTAPRNWKDASKIVSWMQIKLDRAAKYAYPLAQRNLSVDEVQRKQDDLVERFVREMRKPAREAVAEAQDSSE